MENLQLNYRSLCDHVATILRKMILNGVLKPGDRINQAQMAEKMNISRGPLREALRILQNEGLVTHEINRGTFVSTLSENDAREIYTLRALLESEAAELAMIHMSDSEYTKLEQVLDEYKQALLQKDAEKMIKCDMEFHRTIVLASRHQRLAHFHQQLDIQLGAMFLTIVNKVPIRINQVIETHSVLLDALKSKNKSQIRKVFSDHYLAALTDLIGDKQNQS